MKCQTLHGKQGQYPAGYTSVGPKVWAWLEPNGSWGEANSGLVVGDGVALVVDTLWDDVLAARMLEAAVPLLDGTPVTVAVNTHRDGDHWWGNVVLPPDIPIWTSAQALEEISHEPPPAALARLASLSRLGTRLPARVGRLSRYTVDMLGPFGHQGLRVRPPTHAFEDSHTLDIGGRQVDLILLGPAHTAGDLVVHLPADGVVFAGDLLFTGVTPIIWNGPVAQWIRALDHLLALDAEVYVPGHGPLAGRNDITALRDYWEWLVVASQREIDAGHRAGEATRALSRDPEFQRFRDWHSPERLALNVLARYREHAGSGPAGTDPISRTAMFTAVAELGHALSRP